MRWYILKILRIFVCWCGEGMGTEATIISFNSFSVHLLITTSLTGLLQMSPTFENVTVNGSLPKVGNFDVFE